MHSARGVFTALGSVLVCASPTLAHLRRGTSVCPRRIFGSRCARRFSRRGLESGKKWSAPRRGKHRRIALPLPPASLHQLLTLQRVVVNIARQKQKVKSSTKTARRTPPQGPCALTHPRLSANRRSRISAGDIMTQSADRFVDSQRSGRPFLYDIKDIKNSRQT